MAANTDYFTAVGNPGTATSLAAPGHLIGGTAISVGSTSNWPTTTGVVFAIDTVTLQSINGQTVEVRDPGSYTEWEGVVSSSTTVTSLVIRYGTDQNYPAGSTTRVYIPVASSRENRLVTGILEHADQDGTLKAGAVDNTAVLASNVVTTAKILDANVTTTKLADGAVTNVKTNLSGTTDANGWTVLNYGGYKQYLKTFTIPSQTIAGGALLTLTGNNLPTGVTTVGTANIQFALRFASASPFVISNLDGDGTATTIQIGASRSTGSATYTGVAHIMMTI